MEEADVDDNELDVVDDALLVQRRVLDEGKKLLPTTRRIACSWPIVVSCWMNQCRRDQYSGMP